METILGFNKNLLNIVYEKFGDLFNSDIIQEKEGYSVKLKEKISIDDIKEITDDWLLANINLDLNCQDLQIETPNGKLQIVDGFSKICANGIFSQLNDRIIENNNEAPKLLGQILSRADTNMSLVYINY